MRVLLLTAILFLALALPGAAQALDYTAQCSPDGNTCVYDSNAAAWLNAAAHWPGAGPIFDASDLVIGTYTTFTVIWPQYEEGVGDSTPFIGQTVCRGEAPYCAAPFYRDWVGREEGGTAFWHLVFSQPVLGILFDGYVYSVETNEFSLLADRVASDPQRTEAGLPFSPTSFGFLTDHLVAQLDGRQNHDAEGINECCPVPLFAIGPAAVTPTPEPGTWLLVGSGLVGLAGRWVRRRLSASAPRDAHPDPERL